MLIYLWARKRTALHRTNRHASSYRNHTAITDESPEFDRCRVLGLLGHASTFAIANRHEKANEKFLEAIELIEEHGASYEDYYLLFNYVDYLKEKGLLFDAHNWLSYILTVATKYSSPYYESLALYSLYLLNVEQGESEKVAVYSARYYKVKSRLAGNDFIRMSFMEHAMFHPEKPLISRAGKQNSTSMTLILLASSLALFSFGYRYFKKRNSVSVVQADVKLVSDAVGDSSNVEPVSPDLLGDNKEIECKTLTVPELQSLVKAGDYSFISEFNRSFPTFIQFLNSLADTPLNQAEVEICIYTKLGFTTKEIAFYRGDSIRSVENRKYRIRKKLNLSGETDFTMWILNVDNL